MRKSDSFSYLFLNPFLSCFPHIVNLACKAVLEAITNLKYVDETVEGYEDYEPGVFSRDTIALVRSLVNAVSAIYNQILLLLMEYIDS